VLYPAAHAPAERSHQIASVPPLPVSLVARPIRAQNRFDLYGLLGRNRRVDIETILVALSGDVKDNSMNRNRISGKATLSQIVVAAGLVLVCFIGFIWYQHRAQQQQYEQQIRNWQIAIQNVGTEHNRVVDDAFSNMGLLDKYWNPGPTVEKVISGLASIDTSGCPQDFTAAYIEYVQSWSNLRSNLSSNWGWYGFFKGAICGLPCIISATYNAPAEVQKVQQAANKVQMYALKYGVRI